MSRRYYAIGDVHGELKKLERLFETMIDDVDGETVFVFLGDYVDRGPNSREVVRFIREAQRDCKNIEVIALLGNHEDMMFKACRYPTRSDMHLWSINGGEDTLQSYEVEHPKDLYEKYSHDVDWLGRLPYYYKDEENKIIFVHAGILPREFPKIERETAIWTRAVEFFTPDMFWTDEMKEYLVVHGHTPTQTTFVSKNRVGLDTGACFRDLGNLSGARIDTNPRRVTKIFQIGDTPNVAIYNFS